MMQCGICTQFEDEVEKKTIHNRALLKFIKSILVLEKKKKKEKVSKVFFTSKL
jgi:hypothetical protein